MEFSNPMKQRHSAGPKSSLSFSAFLRLASLLESLIVINLFHLFETLNCRIGNLRVHSDSLSIVTPAHQAPSHVNLTSFVLHQSPFEPSLCPGSALITLPIKGCSICLSIWHTRPVSFCLISSPVPSLTHPPHSVAVS